MTLLGTLALSLARLCARAGLAATLAASAPVAASAGEALVAVAANFADAMKDIEAAFETASGHSITVTTGATGKLYAQISAGAPFDIFLSADSKTPHRLEAEGRAVAGTRFTYAIGQLALWSADATLIGADGASVLSTERVRNIAIANPDLAPYGTAARGALTSLKLWETVKDKIVYGENIGQTFSLTASGGGTMAGFVAYSAVIGRENAGKGSVWIVPQKLFQPIRQDAVLLTRASGNEAALALLAFLKSPEATGIVRRFGYEPD